jgi:hypothetical protein
VISGRLGRRSNGGRTFLSSAAGAASAASSAKLDADQERALLLLGRIQYRLELIS